MIFLYFVFLEGLAGATLGKWVLGLCVVRAGRQAALERLVHSLAFRLEMTAQGGAGWRSRLHPAG